MNGFEKMRSGEFYDFSDKETTRRRLVCPGVTIGDRSIIGAGSVVVKEIPEDSVAVGNPARVIKKLK